MARLLTVETMVVRLGEAEMLQIAGTGGWNHPQGRDLDAAKIEAAIAYAEEIVTGYVVARHSWITDLAPEAQPPVLVGAALDLARFRLRDEGGNRSQVSDDVRRRHDDAISRLRDIQAGRFDLPAPANLVAPPADGPVGQVLAIATDRRGDRLLEGYR